MSLEVFAYPFLFIAIFFESFVLVTLLSGPAREARKRLAVAIDGSVPLPSVAVIVPCWNEADTVQATYESLKALSYPADKLSFVFVNDGSTDNTAAIIDGLKDDPQVTVIHKENGGKHTALNAGIAATKADLVGCLDADSFVEPRALREMIPCFNNPQVAAVTAAMSVNKPSNILQHMQSAEYIFGITLRHAMASVNGLYVTPGPFSFYRREVVEALGGFRHGHQTEDMEMALRLQQAGYTIENAPRAQVYTNTPPTVRTLVKQRTRWTTGFLRNTLGEYRGLIGKREFGVLGLLMLPAALLAVGSGIGLFFLMTYQMVSHALTTVAVRAGIPLSYSLLPHGSFDWFYFPTTLYLFLALITVGISVSLIVVGKYISQTPMTLRYGIFSYLLLYVFIAPLWLIRAATDVALGATRAWK